MISIISFTQKGYEQSCAIAKRLQDEADEIRIYTKCTTLKTADIDPIEEAVDEWAAAQMQEKHAVVFIGACGIAVRAIAPAVRDKLSDSPVIVVDELGRFVIPILSGHVGGANELACRIADRIGAVPVITTATDLHGAFAVDVFAGKHKLMICNKEGIAKVSAKVLAGEPITASVDPVLCRKDDGRAMLYDLQQQVYLTEYPPDKPVDILLSPEKDRERQNALLYLRPKQYTLGIGCKKDTDYETIDRAIRKALDEIGIESCEISRIASIDRKGKEPGILEWSRKHRVEFVTYSAEELMSLQGTFSVSEFVRDHVGVDTVCERAAVFACREEHSGKAELVFRKHVYDGVTVAASKCGYR